MPADSNVTAMRELSAKQVQSTEDYINKVRAANLCGNRVVLTRTREPYRVLDTLKFYTFASSTEFRHWDSVNGWTSYIDTDGKSTPDNDVRQAKKDSMIDFLGALRVVNDSVPPAGPMNPGNYTAVFPDGLFAMMYPHPWISEGGNKNPRAVQCLKQYVVEFPYLDNKTLVMIVPEDFKCPVELEDDVAMIDFNLPAIEERFNTILDTLSEVFGEHFAQDKGADHFETFETWAAVLNASSGLTTKNFQDYFTDAILKQEVKKIKELDMEKLAEMIANAKCDLVKRTDILEVMSAEAMSNVGGQDLLKEWIANRRNAFTADARKFGIDAPKGVMLVGPPGTGKSVAAKAIAGTLELPLIRFDVSRVFNSLVGSSEARIRSALKMVDAMEPCVLFIDEIDKVFQSNGGGNDSGVSSRVLGTLLTWMQETKSQVFVVMTANRTQNLPPEMLRKGRLDEIFSVTTPSEEERAEIARIHLRKRGHDPEAEGVDLKAVAAASEGYVPSEIECAIKETLLAAFNGDKEITAKMIIKELEAMVPLSTSFKEDFEYMQEWAANNARPASSKQEKSSALLPSQRSSAGNVTKNASKRRRVGGKSDADDLEDISSN